MVAFNKMYNSNICGISVAMYNSKLDCYCTLPDEELQNMLGMLQN